MTVERRSPLPPGRYWIDVFDPNRVTFVDWLALNKGVVTVETTEVHDTDPPRDFYIFNVLAQVPEGHAPVNWDARVFGFPTIADAGVKGSGDTADKPDLPKDASDQIAEGLDDIGSLGKTVMLGALLVAGALLVSKLVDKKKAAGAVVEA